MRADSFSYWGRKLILIVSRLFVATMVVATFFVLIQDFLIFPGLYSSFLFNRVSKESNLIEALTARAADEHQVNIWRMKLPKESQKVVALVFHGNAEHLDHFIQVQRWLKTLGITSYSVEYRGYNGRNSGWPSEEGFYLDAEAAFKLLLKQENLQAREIVVLGSSIGTGTAANVAQKYNAKALVLISPYSSLKAVVSETALLGYLVPFLKYRFPSDEYINKLTNTCVVAAHGRKGTVIPFHHSEKLRSLYQGDKSFTLIASEDSGHNDLLANEHKRIAQALDNCIADKPG